MAGPISFGYQVLGFGAGKAASASGGGGATTTKVQVRFYQFSGDGNCTCSLTSTYEVWENDVENAGGGLTLSVNDVISGNAGSGSTVCAIVTALNSTSSADGVTVSEYSSCSVCNDNELICSEGGGEGEGEFCLLPHMLVKLIDGSLVKVSDLNVGDLINSPYGFTEITELITDHPRDGYYIIENELYISDDHPILVDNKMIEAKNYPGNKKYVNLSTDTVYVGTASESYYVYCENNVYTVSGLYKDAS